MRVVIRQQTLQTKYLQTRLSGYLTPSCVHRSPERDF